MIEYSKKWMEFNNCMHITTTTDVVTEDIQEQNTTATGDLLTFNSYDTKLIFKSHFKLM